MTPKQKARRERILSMTLKLIRKRGYESVNMRDLAEAAGVSPTTLYRLFDNKESLILETVKQTIEQITASVAAEEEAGLRHMFALLRSLVRGFVDEQGTAGVIPPLLFMAEPGAPATEVLLANAIRARRASVIDMQEAGEIDPNLDVENLARQLTMATWGPLIQFAKGFIDINHLADEMVKASIWTLLPILTKEGLAKALSEIERHPRLSTLTAPLKAQNARLG